MKLFPTAVIVVVASAILWGMASLISSETGVSEESKRVAENQSTKPSINQNSFVPTGSLLRQKESVDNDPDNLELRFNYAESLLRTGTNSSDVSAIIASISEFSKVLERDPKHPAALLALARVSFETGAVENSISYFDRYLTIKPKDKRARNDLALAYMQARDYKTSIAILEELTFRHQDYFESRFGLAMARRLNGETEQAKIDADVAFNLASTDRQKDAVKTFISTMALRAEELQAESASSSNKKETELVASSASAPNSESAQALENYLKSHPILSEKLVAIDWTSYDQAEVVLKEFPIIGMPQVAKDTFRAKAQASLATSLAKHKFSVILTEQKNPSSRFNLLHSE